MGGDRGRERSAPPRDPAYITTPASLTRAIEASTSGVKKSASRRIEALRQLHERFTRERAGMGQWAYLDIPALRDAYLRYYVPVNAARVECVLRDLDRVYPAYRELSEVVDLGAGPGSASLALLAHEPASKAQEFHLFDRSGAALRSARKLIDETASGRRLRVHTGAVRLPVLPRIPPRALVLSSLVLNELGLGARRGFDAGRFLGELAKRLAPPSVAIFVEPALRVSARGLLELHDAALHSGGWKVLAPCTHQQLCPLLRERDRSWCHFHFRWSAPAMVCEGADRVGIDSEDLSVAYLALERDPGMRPVEGLPVPVRANDRRDLEGRVLGDLMVLRAGGRGSYACIEGERRVVPEPPGGLERGDRILEGPDGRVRVDCAWSRAPEGG